MCPAKGQHPQFAQLYIHDTENDVKTAMPLCHRLIQQRWIVC
jgi:hypothetical protein